MLATYMRQMRNNKLEIRIAGSKHTNVQGSTSAQLSHRLGGWGQNLGHTICYACKLSTAMTAPNSIENPEPMCCLSPFHLPVVKAMMFVRIYPNRALLKAIKISCGTFLKFEACFLSEGFCFCRL